MEINLYENMDGHFEILNDIESCTDSMSDFRDK